MPAVFHFYCLSFFFPSRHFIHFVCIFCFVFVFFAFSSSPASLLTRIACVALTQASAHLDSSVKLHYCYITFIVVIITFPFATSSLFFIATVAECTGRGAARLILIALSLWLLHFSFLAFAFFFIRLQTLSLAT